MMIEPKKPGQMAKDAGVLSRRVALIKQNNSTIYTLPVPEKSAGRPGPFLLRQERDLSRSLFSIAGQNTGTGPENREEKTMRRNPDLYALVAELRSYRRSQKQIAHALNLSKTYVSQICRNLDRQIPPPELPPLLLERIADYKSNHAR